MRSIDKVCADPYGLEIPWCWSLEKLCHSIGNKHRPYFVFRHLSTQFVDNGWTGVFARHQNLYIPYCRHGNGVQCDPGILYCRWKWSPSWSYSSKHHISSEPEHSTFLPHSTTFFGLYGEKTCQDLLRLQNPIEIQQSSELFHLITDSREKFSLTRSSRSENFKAKLGLFERALRPRKL